MNFGARPNSPTASLAPQLAPHYHAGGGAGVLGLGWSLDLPAIERSTRAGIPRADIPPVWQLRHLGDGEELTETAPGMFRQRIEQGAPIVVRALPGLATDGTGYLFGLTDDARLVGDVVDIGDEAGGRCCSQVRSGRAQRSGSPSSLVHVSCMTPTSMAA